MTGVHARPQTIAIAIAAAVARPRRAPHRRRHRRRRAAPAAAARRAARAERISAALPRARPRAGARPSSRRCCAGSARCAICSAACSSAACRRRRRASKTMLLIGAAQILFLDVPDHAAVDLSVRLAQADRHAAHYSGLVNAVLRRLAREGTDAPRRRSTRRCSTRRDWLMQRWIAHYGEATARAIAVAQRQEPALDLTVKSDPASWAAALDGRVLPTGTVRTVAQGRSRCCPATTRAPGGCRTPPPPAGAAARRRRAASASPISAPRPAARPRSLRWPARRSPRSTARRRGSTRLRENLARLQLSAEIVAADAAEWQGGPFDAVLVDAPCSSTGTIRRHPDIALAQVRGRPRQARRRCRRRLLDRAVDADQARRHAGLLHLLARSRRRASEQIDGAARRAIRRCAASPIRADEVAGHAEFLTADGRPAHPALLLARPRARAWAGSTASTPPGSCRDGFSA